MLTALLLLLLAAIADAAATAAVAASVRLRELREDKTFARSDLCAKLELCTHARRAHRTQHSHITLYTVVFAVVMGGCWWQAASARQTYKQIYQIY